MSAPTMKCWVHTNFRGFWGVGVAAVAWAESAEDALTLLRAAVAAKGLDPDTVGADDLVEVDVTSPHAMILNDGNY